MKIPRMNRLEQAFYGIGCAINILKYTEVSTNKRDKSYKLNNSLFNFIKYIVIPRDLKLPKNHDYITEERLFIRLGNIKYKCISCRSIGDVVDCLTMLSNYIGSKVK